jgi:hypothetical protein
LDQVEQRQFVFLIAVEVRDEVGRGPKDEETAQAIAQRQQQLPQQIAVEQTHRAAKLTRGPTRLKASHSGFIPASA